MPPRERESRSLWSAVIAAPRSSGSLIETKKHDQCETLNTSLHRGIERTGKTHSLKVGV